METKTVNKTGIDVIISMYDLHTRLFHNVLVDITEKDAANRLGTKANHISWLAGSLVQGRYSIANEVGIDLKQTSDELFANFRGIIDNAVYPSLQEYKKDWDKISPMLRETLINLTEEQLEGPDPFEMPGGNYTLFDTLTFCFDRESYCIGQIGLYRRLLGYDAMKYD
jgi:hypothetical protein